ncbi:MAG: hypothetical protein R2855_04600 [Thermomicrobiales bacterium]
MLPTGKLLRDTDRLSPPSRLRQQSPRDLLGVGLFHLFTCTGAFHDVLQGGVVGKEIEPLEDHSDLLPGRRDLPHGIVLDPAIDHVAIDVLTVQQNAPLFRLLQTRLMHRKVDLPLPDVTDDANHLAAIDRQRDPAKHMGLAETLVNSIELIIGMRRSLGVSCTEGAPPTGRRR